MNLPTQALPVPLPGNPFEIVAEWLDQARKDAAQPNPNAMVIATVDGAGNPSARVVLCKGVLIEAGGIIFVTNYDSRKGQELAQTGKAALVFHWDHRHRQVRIEGHVQPLTAQASDDYFASRPWQSQLGAWASLQSQPVDSLATLRQQVANAASRFGIDYQGPGTPEPHRIDAVIPRPPHWGGMQLTATAIELWIEGEFRIHERVRWTRSAALSAWQPQRLQP